MQRIYYHKSHFGLSHGGKEIWENFLGLPAVVSAIKYELCGDQIRGIRLPKSSIDDIQPSYIA
jgi:hypothetical protein